MLFAQLESRFREVLIQVGGARAPDDGSVRFAADFTRLLVGILPNRITVAAMQEVRRAIAAHCALSPAEIDALVALAMAPEYRGNVSDDDLRAYSGRFGRAEGEALRMAVAEETDLAGFAQRYGSAAALLLFDSLFAVCGVDGVIDREEITSLQRDANELGIDAMLVGAMLRKYDVRHARGDFEVKLTGERLVIGRATTAAVQLPDPAVALRHAELMRGPEGWRVVDLQSGRPTLIDGEPIRSAPLRPGQSLRVGPYTLEIDRDAESIHAFGPTTFSSLAVRDLARKIGPVPLLDSVSFTVFSGEVIAVVGPSGAGKTTLLHAIAGVVPADSGDVLLDGQPFHKLLAHDRSLVGVVPQDDIVHPELTVAESLTYSARLRFPADVGPEVLSGEVNRVLDELGIQHIRDARIGDAVRRGISGGQRKRVNLGQELLSRSTRVLFLDEPTSGLDPHTSQEILGLVRQLADGGRIVFIVTHDMSPAVLHQVDHLMVLAPGGRLAWFGPPDEATSWFGVTSPDQIFARLPSMIPEEWGRRYREGDPYRKYVRTREHLLGLDAIEVRRPATPPLPRPSRRAQLRTLTNRYLTVKLRDRSGLMVLVAQAPILGLAMWIVFPRADTGTLFMLSLSSLWFGASASVRELISERPLWRREARVGIGVGPYLTAKVLVLGGFVAIQCALLASMNWFLLDMGAVDGDKPLAFSLLEVNAFTIATGQVGMALGLMLSSLFASSEAAVAALPIVLIPQITFGGLLVKLKGMPAVGLWISAMMVTRYSFDGLVKSGRYLWAPNAGYQPKEPLSQLGVLSDIGFRAKDASIEDLGHTQPELFAILGAFYLGFLGVTAWATARATRE